MILVGLTSQPHWTRSRTQWVQKWSKLSCQHLKPIQECKTQFSFSRISILDIFLSKACLSRSFLTGKLKTLVLLGFIFTIFLVNALCFLHGWILIFLVNVFCFLNEWILLEKIDYEFLKTFLYWFFSKQKIFTIFFNIFLVRMLHPSYQMHNTPCLPSMSLFLSHLATRSRPKWNSRSRAWEISSSSHGFSQQPNNCCCMFLCDISVLVRFDWFFIYIFLFLSFFFQEFRFLFMGFLGSKQLLLYVLSVISLFSLDSIVLFAWNKPIMTINRKTLQLNWVFFFLGYAQLLFRRSNVWFNLV